MNSIKRNKIGKVSVKIIVLLILSICSQYILTGVYIGKEITGSIKERNASNLCSKWRWRKK